MNDCLWCFIRGLCEGRKCNKCSRYLSVNSEEGLSLFTKYQKEVDQTLLPLTKKWREKMNEYTTN